MSVRKFFVHYSHFFTGSALVQMLGLVSFPIITRVLSVEQYGILGLVTTTMFVMLCFAKAGLSDGIIRFYKQYAESPDRLLVFSSTVVVRGVILASVVALLFVLVFPSVSGLINVAPEYNRYFLIMAGFLLIRPLNIIVLNILRVAEKTVMYNLVNLLAKVLSIALSLVLLIFVVGDFYGYFVGLVIAELLVFAFLFRWFLTRHTVRLKAVSGPLAFDLMKFGAPLLLSELSYLLLTYVDRYMIMAYMGEGALGIYSVGSNLASYVNDLIMFSLSYAVIPIYIGIYEKEGRKKTEEFLSRCLHYLLIAVMAVLAGYAATIEDLLDILASDKYLVAASFSPIILLGSFFLGMNSVLRAGLYLRKDTVAILGIILSSLVLNVVLNLYMIPAYGVTGAALSQVISCAFATALTVLLSFRHIFIRVDPWAALYYAAASALMYLAIFWITMPLVVLTLAVKVAVGSAIIAAAVLYREKEVRRAFSSMNPLARKRGA